MADLKDKRIALNPPESSADDFFKVLMEHYRLTSSNLDIVTMEREAADAAFVRGEIDAVFRVRPPGNRPIQDLVQNSGAKIIPIDQAAAIRINRPEFEPATIPKGAYQGNVATPDRDLPTVSIRRMLVARSEVEPEVIRELTRILYEHRQELTTRMPLATQISPPSAVGGTILPIHPGAAAYYDREKPSLIEQNSDSLGLLLTIGLAAGSWLWQIKERVERVQKNRSDSYNQDIIKLIHRIKEGHEVDQLDAFRDQLYEQFEIIVNALDKDQITPEAFQSLRFTWEAAMYALRDREVWLANHRSSQKR